MRLHANIIRFIKRLIEVIYPIFKPLMNRRIYYFCATGSISCSVNVIAFYLSIHLFYHSAIRLNNFVILPYIASWLTAQIVSIFVGFDLNYHIVFPESNLKLGTQFSRFIITNILNILLTYLIISLLVEILNWYPTVALTLATLIAAIVNYFTQQKFSFQKKIN